MKLYRSVLYVPGNRPEWMDKAPKYGADALILDLEDAVPIPEKVAARAMVRAAIKSLRPRDVPVLVRLNGVGTGLTTQDLEAVVIPGLVGVVLPKLERVEEVLKVDAWIELYERKVGLAIGTVEIVVLPETARGIMNAYQLVAACPRVGNIMAGIGSRSGDITRALGTSWTPNGLESLYMASHMMMAARAAGVTYPLAGGSLEVRDTEVVRAQLRRAREIGFRGTVAIHPSAVPIANEVFGLSTEEIEWNKGVLRAMAGAEQAGRAAVMYDGMMVGYAHARNALDLLHQAEAFGIDVGEYPHLKPL